MAAVLLTGLAFTATLSGCVSSKPALPEAACLSCYEESAHPAMREGASAWDDAKQSAVAGQDRKASNAVDDALATLGRLEGALKSAPAASGLAPVEAAIEGYVTAA